MSRKPTYEELEQRVKDLEEGVTVHKRTEEALGESSIVSDTHEPAIDLIRNKLLTGILYTLSIFGLPAIVAGGIETVSQGRLHILLIYVAVYVSVLICTLFSEKLSFQLRTTATLGAIYILGSGTLFRFGLSGAGIHFLITFCVLTTVLSGMRLGLTAVVVSIASIAFVGTGMSTGLIPISPIIMMNSTSAVSWCAAGAVFAVIGVAMVICPGMLQHRLQMSLQLVNQRTAELEASNRKLAIEIHERTRLEKKLFQSQKMESIGTLAGGIAHDFNNILSSVIGFTELSLDEVEKGTHIEDNLQEVYTAGKRAKDLVRQILAFARQSEEELKPIYIDMIATEVLNFIRSSIPATIEIKQNIESDSLIMGNATQVHQILMNLFTNAAHAMEDNGGVLAFSLKDVVLDRGVNREKLDLKPGNYIEMKVSDTGTGIAPEIIDSIFDPYFTTKGPGEGTGMGLATVHGIVESYGGKISVDSKPGQGTLFAIYLPVSRKRQEHHPYQSETLPTGKERILFVDDEAPIAKMGGQALERLGYTVSIRTSSIEALELLRTKPNDFDLVITDMTMPNMAGDRLAIELMKIRPDIPIILCTGYSKRISDETASEIGIKEFAYKPVVMVDLAKIVRKVLDDQQQDQTAGRILLIDDESAIRKLFIQKLAGRGYEIIEACDGKEGLKLYRENHPDLVITDLIMSEKEGIEMIIELKREFPNVKIIAISGGGRNATDAYLQIAKTMGAERIFPKPIDWSELIKAIRELLT